MTGHCRERSVNIPGKIRLAGLVTKVLSITLLYAFVPVAISTVGPLTVCHKGKERRRGSRRQRREGREKTLLISLALQSASVMPVQHFLANLIEQKQRVGRGWQGKKRGLRLMKDQGKVSQSLQAFILCHVGSDSVVYYSYALQGTKANLLCTLRLFFK